VCPAAKGKDDHIKEITAMQWCGRFFFEYLYKCLDIKKRSADFVLLYKKETLIASE